MLVQELLKIVRRRGMYWSHIGAMLLAVVATLVVTLVVRGTQGEGDFVSRLDVLHACRDVLSFAGFVMAALIGAQEGAYDVQQGTFRYLVMTGRSKLGLYLVRYPAFAIAVVAGMLPAMALAALGAVALGQSVPDGVQTTDATGIGASDLALLVWQPVLVSLVFGAIALAVGALLRSVGGAIVVALVLNLAGFNLLALLTLISDSLDRVVLPIAIGVLTGSDDFGVPTAIVVVLAWLAVFVVAGAVRTTRAEY
ncbi:MAG: hypothetical protein U0237_18920 [Thermoleophilia bacterium]